MTSPIIVKVDDGRSPVRWLNYRSRIALTPTRPVGPTTMGEYLWPVEVQYDPATHTSRVGFSYIQPS